MVSQNNKYANDMMKSENNTTGFISGNKWQRDITIDEIIIFFGIMLHMCLRPIPGRPYTDAWNYTDWHTYTKHMICIWLKQIRAVLHMSDNEHPQGKKDSLWKIIPLLNTLRLSIDRFVNVGDNLELDETNVASKSSYSRHLIVYNATKTTGKYHFRFYMLSCSTTHILLSFKIHTQDNIDCLNNYPSTDTK